MIFSNSKNILYGILFICMFISIIFFLMHFDNNLNAIEKTNNNLTQNRTYQGQIVLDGESSDYILSQDRLVAENTIYLIQDKFDLNGQNINIPSNCLLLFEGGCLCNGSITGSYTDINNAFPNNVIFEDARIKGTWYVSEISDTWFSFNPDADNHNDLLNSILTLTDDDHYNIVTLSSDRLYKLQDIYTGTVDLGTMVRPNYSILQSDEQRPNHEILRLKSNTKLVLNSKIQMNPTRNGIYFLLSIVDKENVEICGCGAIYGDVKNHLYDTPFVKNSNYYGEWGHIIAIRNSKNITLRDITVAEAFGDGIIVTNHVINIERNPKDPSYMPSKGSLRGPSSFVTIDNVKVMYCRRNGIAGAAHYWTISNCHFEGNGIDEIKGTAPKAAIDFENDYIKINPKTCNQNTVMANCEFRNNGHDVSSTNNSPKSFNGFATIVRDCIFTAPLRLNVTHNFLFDSCEITRITNVKDSSFYFEKSHNLVFKNCMIKELHPYLQSSSKHGYKFVNCKIGTPI